MSYKHISPSNRNELSALLRAGLKQNQIAKLINKHRTTIWREKKRNSTKNKIGYNVKIAKENTTQRRLKANKHFKKIKGNTWLRAYIIRKIKKYWSPEQISGRLKKDYLEEKNKQIGKDCIYKFIYNERKDLIKFLRCQKGKYRRRYGTRIREKERERLKKKRIDTRPNEVETKERIGDWEGDTIVGSDKSHILTHVERKSGFLLADKLINGTSELTKTTTIQRFKKIPKSKQNTITYDNGSTFFEYELTEKATGMLIYFAYPYHSWERGCNENANGLLRQFFPKKSSFAKVTQEDIKKAVKLINNRPRKRLNYLTPFEVFNKS